MPPPAALRCNDCLRARAKIKIKIHPALPLSLAILSSVLVHLSQAVRVWDTFLFLELADGVRASYRRLLAYCAAAAAVR